jgi:acyl-CoA reductase-like NAD-dependent aldehyde dehydrogenase
MCTTPQNLFVPRDGIDADDGRKSVDDIIDGLGGALAKLVGEDARAVEILGGIVNDGVLDRLNEASEGGSGEVVLASRAVAHPAFAEAVVRTPALLRVDVKDGSAYEHECFGPVSYLVTTSSTEESIDAFRATATQNGAMTAAVYSTRGDVIDAMRGAALDAGVALSENLTGPVFVNQSAAFSDFHGTGANPAANSTYTDGAYVASRFRFVQSRRHIG